MRGTEKTTEIRDIDVDAIALVGRPAIGRPYAIIKSEDVKPEEKPLLVPDVAALIKAEIEEQFKVFKAAYQHPVPANNSPFPETVTDPNREPLLKSIKELVASSSEMLKEQRENLAVIAKYHGVEPPKIFEDEDPKVSPAMQSMMSKMDGIITAVSGLVTAMQNPAPTKSDAPVKKDDDAKSNDEIDSKELADAIEMNKKLRKQFDLLNWKFIKASGKDPGPKPE